MTNVRSGTSKRMTTGNPIAAESVFAVTSGEFMRRVGWAPKRTYRLRDGKGRTETDELDGDEQDQTRFADFAEGLVARCEGVVSEEVEQFEGNAISLESGCTHVPATKCVQYSAMPCDEQTSLTRAQRVPPSG